MRTIKVRPYNRDSSAWIVPDIEWVRGCTLRRLLVIVGIQIGPRRATFPPVRVGLKWSVPCQIFARPMTSLTKLGGSKESGQHDNKTRHKLNFWHLEIFWKFFTNIQIVVNKILANSNFIIHIKLIWNTFSKVNKSFLYIINQVQ